MAYHKHFPAKFWCNLNFHCEISQQISKAIQKIRDQNKNNKNKIINKREIENRK